MSIKNFLDIIDLDYQTSEEILELYDSIIINDYMNELLHNDMTILEIFYLRFEILYGKEYYSVDLILDDDYFVFIFSDVLFKSNSGKNFFKRKIEIYNAYFKWLFNKYVMNLSEIKNSHQYMKENITIFENILNKILPISYEDIKNINFSRFNSHKYGPLFPDDKNDINFKDTIHHSHDDNISILNPKQEYPFDYETAIEFVKLFSNDIEREIYTILVKNTVHISFNLFIKHLYLIAIDILNNGLSEQRIVILIDYIFKSSGWCLYLIWNIIEPVVHDIIKYKDILNYLNTDDGFIFIYLDDCLYTGSQFSQMFITSTIIHRIDRSNSKIIFCIPYFNVTSPTISILDSKNVNITYCSLGLINLEKLTGMSDKEYNNVFLTLKSVPIYFDHKIASNISTPQKFYTLGDKNNSKCMIYGCSNYYSKYSEDETIGILENNRDKTDDLAIVLFPNDICPPPHYKTNPIMLDGLPCAMLYYMNFNNVKILLENIKFIELDYESKALIAYLFSHYLFTPFISRYYKNIEEFMDIINKFKTILIKDNYEHAMLKNLYLYYIKKYLFRIDSDLILNVKSEGIRADFIGLVKRVKYFRELEELVNVLNRIDNYVYIRILNDIGNINYVRKILDSNIKNIEKFYDAYMICQRFFTILLKKYSYSVEESNDRFLSFYSESKIFMWLEDEEIETLYNKVYHDVYKDDPFLIFENAISYITNVYNENKNKNPNIEPYHIRKYLIE